MTQPLHSHATVDDWITQATMPFAVDSAATFDAAADTLIASLGDSVQVLGFGEALHGSEEILRLRNQLFKRLVEQHGYSAIAIESSFPRSRVVNEYVAGRGPASYDEIQDTGFGVAFGRLEANRELVNWMRQRNADPSQRVKLRFYGFDVPTGTSGMASPRTVLDVVLAYLEAHDPARGQKHRERVDALLGHDFDWENPAAIMDHTKSIGASPAATALRIATEELIAELRAQRPALIATSGAEPYAEALHYGSIARELLNFHAVMARELDIAERLGIRDASMADNLTYVMERERGRGKILVFAHNSHVKRGKAEWQMGADISIWWPVGAHLDAMLGDRYAVIGTGLGVSEENGIGEPEAGTLEARLIATPGPARFIPTQRGHGLPADELSALPIRSGSPKNRSYAPLTPQNVTEFDWLAVVDSSVYNRGGLPLEAWSNDSKE